MKYTDNKDRMHSALKRKKAKKNRFLTIGKAGLLTGLLFLLLFEQDSLIQNKLFADSSFVNVYASTANADNSPIMAEIYYTESTGEVTKNSTYELPYNEAVFQTSSYEYQNDLARISLGLSASAGTSAVSDLFENFVFDSADNLRSANCKATLTSLGFSDLSFYHYEIPTTDSSDKVAFVLGSKTIMVNGEQVLLVAAALRGIGYGNEWASNFKVGTGMEHQGFLAAAQDVKESLDAYVELQSSQKGTASVKIWITGYSRAGAVANLVAARLDEDSSYSQKDVYAYTFSAPNTVKDTEKAEESVYQNIFNLRNAEDLVTTLPFPAWGYSIYGRDCSFPLLLEGYDSALFQGAEISSGNGMAVVGNLDDLLVRFYPTVQIYTASLQQQLIEQITQSDSSGENMFDIMNQSMSESLMGSASDSLFSGMDAASVASSHGPDVYLSWFELGTTMDTFQYASYLRFIIDDTADITIKGASGTILFQSRSGEILTSVLPAQINLDRFVIYLYGDSSFSYEITGAATVGFHIEEYKKLLACNRVVAFDLLELSNQPWKGTVSYDIISSPQDYVLQKDGQSDYLPEHDSGEILPGQYLDYSAFEGINTSAVTDDTASESSGSAAGGSEPGNEGLSETESSGQSASENGSESSSDNKTETSVGESNNYSTDTSDSTINDSTDSDANASANENSSSKEEASTSKSGMLYIVLGGAAILIATGFLLLRLRRKK